MMGDTFNTEKFEPIPGTFILVPPRTKIILVVSLKSDAELDILISQPFSRQKYSLVPPFGGTLFCLCNINLAIFHVFLESKSRCYRVVKVQTHHVFLLVEETWNPHTKPSKIPRLWELAAVNLLLQGYVHTDCQVLLESPLLTWKRINFLLPPNPVPIRISCANPNHTIARIPDNLLCPEFWD